MRPHSSLPSLLTPIPTPLTPLFGYISYAPLSLYYMYPPLTPAGKLDGARILAPRSIEFLTQNRLGGIPAPLGKGGGLPLEWLRSVANDGLGRQGQALLGYRSSDEEFLQGRQEGPAASSPRPGPEPWPQTRIDLGAEPSTQP